MKIPKGALGIIGALIITLAIYGITAGSINQLEKSDIVLLVHSTNYAWVTKDTGEIITKNGARYVFDLSDTNYMQDNFVDTILTSNKLHRKNNNYKELAQEILNNIQDIEYESEFIELNQRIDYGTVEYFIQGTDGEMYKLFQLGDWYRLPLSNTNKQLALTILEAMDSMSIDEVKELYDTVDINVWIHGDQ